MIEFSNASVMMLYFWAFFWLLVRADSTFLSPFQRDVDPLQNYTIGSQVVLNWTTDWGPELISLKVYERFPNSENYVSSNLINNQTDPGNYVWTVQALSGLSPVIQFHFEVSLGEANAALNKSDTDHFLSVYGQILDASSTTSKTDATPSPTTSQAYDSSRTTTLNSEPTGSIIESTQQSSTESTTPTSSTHNLLDNAANIATIAGVPLACVAIFLTWYGFRKQRNGERLVLSKIKDIRRSFSDRKSLRPWSETIEIPCSRQDSTIADASKSHGKEAYLSGSLFK